MGPNPSLGIPQLVPPRTGPELRTARVEADMTQADLAAAARVSIGLVKHWESGRKPIPEGRLPELARIFASQAPAKAPSLSGSRWRAMRIRAELDQPTVARILGLSQQAVALWETNGVPKDRRLVLISAVTAPEGFVAGLVRAERMSVGLKQQELGVRLGIPQAMVSEWERGKIAVPNHMWPAIREALTRSARDSPQQPVTAFDLQDGRRWARRFAVAPARRLEVAPLRVGCCV